MNFYEVVFITYAGMIRGAIAFALVLTLPYKVPNTTECSENGIPYEYCVDYPIYEMLVTTTLILVVLTTFIFGTFMGIV